MFEKSRCLRCRGTVEHKASAFCVVLRRKRGQLVTDIARTNTIVFGMNVMHVNGDRQCGKPVAAYKKHILEAVGIEEDLDVDFLDYI